MIQNVTADKRGGKIGVLMLEYHRAIEQLKECLSQLPTAHLDVQVDTASENPPSLSIQTILTHVVRCGHMYVEFIEAHKGIESQVEPKATLSSYVEYCSALDAMYARTVELFNDIDQSEMDEYNPMKKIQTYWGQLYDYEQLMEHAIVHILRHRRQIEVISARIANELR